MLPNLDETWLNVFGEKELCWLTKSPDLNHTEHLWDKLEQRLLLDGRISLAVTDLISCFPGWMGKDSHKHTLKYCVIPSQKSGSSQINRLRMRYHKAPLGVGGPLLIYLFFHPCNVFIAFFAKKKEKGKKKHKVRNGIWIYISGWTDQVISSEESWICCWVTSHCELNTWQWFGMELKTLFAFVMK